MIGFIIGFFAGGIFGVALMCIMSVAGHSDKMIEKNTEQNADPAKDHRFNPVENAEIKNKGIREKG